MSFGSGVTLLLRYRRVPMGSLGFGATEPGPHIEMRSPDLVKFCIQGVRENVSFGWDVVQPRIEQPLHVSGDRSLASMVPTLIRSRSYSDRTMTATVGSKQIPRLKG